MSARVAQADRMMNKGDWVGARRIFRSLLRTHPGDHWLMTRIGVTFYEQHRYREGLAWEKKNLVSSRTAALPVRTYVVRDSRPGSVRDP
jgi:hypothetical protein